MKKIILILLVLSIKICPQNIAIIAIPKCGTNLLKRCLQELTGLPFIGGASDWIMIDDKQIAQGNFISHAIYTKENLKKLEDNKFKVIFIYRDPRDQIVSNAHFIVDGHSGVWPRFKNLNVVSAMNLWVTDTSSYLGPHKVNGWWNPAIKNFGDLNDFYQKYLPWINCNLVYSTTFEKLVGKKGGGSDEEQFIEIEKIIQHLNLDVPEDQIQDITKKIFGNTYTFRTGQIGSWKKAFNNKLKEKVKKIVGDIVISLNYEENYDW